MNPSTLKELHLEIAEGRHSSRSLTQAALERARTSNSELQIMNHIDESAALAQADKADRRRAAGEQGPLLGIPVVIKDNMNVEGMPTSCSSAILDGYISPYDATVVERLKAAGAVILGKASMDEFAMGSSNENANRMKTRNPRDPERVPGGSSGGSAAAVAAGIAPLALGSDTGGSIRQPAAFCGTVGMKPTYGTVSRYGLVAFASSLDQIGPLANSVTDAAELLQAIAGPCQQDSTSLRDYQVPDLLGAAGNIDVRGLRVGLPREYLVDGLAPEIRRQVNHSADLLRQAGAEVVDISLPHTEYAIAAYYIIATAEASANLARFDGVRYGRRAEDATDLAAMYTNTRAQGFGPEVKRRIMLGTYVLSSGYYDAYYRKAQRVRRLIAQDFQSAFEQTDLLLMPTTPATAFRQGEKIDDPLAMYLQDVFTIAANLAGLPAISLPAGVDQHGLPIGVQLYANALQEPTLLRGAAGLEALLG